MKVKLSTGVWDVDDSTFKGCTVYDSRDLFVPARGAQTKDYMDTCVHEALHASRRSFTESEVVKLAADVTAVLWAMGYRKRTKKASS